MKLEWLTLDGAFADKIPFSASSKRQTEYLNYFTTNILLIRSNIISLFFTFAGTRM